MLFHFHFVKSQISAKKYFEVFFTYFDGMEEHHELELDKSKYDEEGSPYQPI